MRFYLACIILYPEREEQEEKTVIYTQVSIYDQKKEVHRQGQRLRDISSEQGLSVAQKIAEIDSALNGKR